MITPLLGLDRDTEQSSIHVCPSIIQKRKSVHAGHLSRCPGACKRHYRDPRQRPVCRPGTQGEEKEGVAPWTQEAQKNSLSPRLTGWGHSPRTREVGRSAWAQGSVDIAVDGSVCCSSGKRGTGISGNICSWRGEPRSPGGPLHLPPHLSSRCWLALLHCPSRNSFPPGPD